MFEQGGAHKSIKDLDFSLDAALVASIRRQRLPNLGPGEEQQDCFPTSSERRGFWFCEIFSRWLQAFVVHHCEEGRNGLCLDL